MMPRCYSADFVRTVSAGDFTGFTLASAATIRPEIYYLQIGSAGTPADTAHLWVARRFTAAGTGTAFTPNALDPGDPASLAACAHTHTTEPTYTDGSHLLNIPMNQKGTYQWMAVKEGRGLKCPATAANGIGIEGNVTGWTPTVPAIAYGGTVHFCE
jgi:hypothetical protein